MQSRHKVFIDGSSGTTGLRLAGRLAARADVEVLPIGEGERKDVAARLERMARADVSVLCLPDEGAREIVAAVDAAAKRHGAGSPYARIRIIDCSTAHRTAPGWVYGLPEIMGDGAGCGAADGNGAERGRDGLGLCGAADGNGAERGRDGLGLCGAADGNGAERGRDEPSLCGAGCGGTRVANPGCHATGFILLVRPLALAGLVAPDAPIAFHSVTGYSGGGKQMIADYEGGVAAEPRSGDGVAAEPGSGDGVAGVRGEPGRDEPGACEYAAPVKYAAPRQYGLSQAHKHLPEMAMHAGLSRPPAFAPIVSGYHSGMLVSVPIPGEGLRVEDVHGALSCYYNKKALVKVRPIGHDPEGGFLAADAFSGRDDAEIIVCGAAGRVTAICRFDNLGKGAAGVALQNINRMLGVPETLGLVTGD